MGKRENETRPGQGRGKRSSGEDGSERRRWYGGEPAMNDRNQRNTAPRKLPGIHPEYIIHTGVPVRRPPRWVKGSRIPERTRPRRKRSVPVKSRTIDRAKRTRESRLHSARPPRIVPVSTRRPSNYAIGSVHPFAPYNKYIVCNCIALHRGRRLIRGII